MHGLICYIEITAAKGNHHTNSIARKHFLFELYWNKICCAFIYLFGCVFFFNYLDPIDRFCFNRFVYKSKIYYKLSERKKLSFEKIDLLRKNRCDILFRISNTVIILRFQAPICN